MALVRLASKLLCILSESTSRDVNKREEEKEICKGYIRWTYGSNVIEDRRHFGWTTCEGTSLSHMSLALSKTVNRHSVQVGQG